MEKVDLARLRDDHFKWWSTVLGSQNSRGVHIANAELNEWRRTNEGMYVLMRGVEQRHSYESETPGKGLAFLLHLTRLTGHMLGKEEEDRIRKYVTDTLKEITEKSQLAREIDKPKGEEENEIFSYRGRHALFYKHLADPSFKLSTRVYEGMPTQGLLIEAPIIKVPFGDKGGVSEYLFAAEKMLVNMAIIGAHSPSYGATSEKAIAPKKE